MSKEIPTTLVEQTKKEIPTALVEQTKKAFAPAQELSRLVVDNAEKLVALQLASVQSYFTLAFSQLKAALEVDDAEAFQKYIAKQNELVKSVGERFADDAQKVTELGNDFSAKALKLGQESVEAVAQKAA
jgi:phasin family protein